MESDDSEDFGPLQANTPNKPKAVVTMQSKLGSSRAANEAGPSRLTNSKIRKKTTTAEELSDNDEVQEIPPRNLKNRRLGAPRGKRKQQKTDEDGIHHVNHGGDDEDDGMDDVQEVEPPRPNNVRAVAKKPTSKTDSTGFNAKGKGKQKAKVGPASRSQMAVRQEPGPVDVDMIEVPDDEDDAEDMQTAKEHTNFALANNASASSGILIPTQSQMQEAIKQKERLERKLHQSLQHIEDLERQLQELHQVRQTEPEQLMERMELQHKAELAARDDLNRQYADQLAQKEPLFHSGTGFEILTREQVNKETQHLQRRIREQDQVILQYRDNLETQNHKLNEKDKEIEALKEDKRYLRLQLDAETDRSNALLQKSAQSRKQEPSQSRPRTGGFLGASSDPKYSTIISFYEDLTNVIVPHMKSLPGKYLDTDDWVLHCCYTHRDVVNKRTSRSAKSISFNLRLCYDLKPGAKEPVVSKDQLAQSVQYIPLDLDKESPEFRESLGFLGETFTFERDQLSLFVRTLYDYISGEDGEDEKAEDDDSVQIME